MNKIEIVIGDKKYNVKTDESPEYVKNIETVLNDQINSIANANTRCNERDKMICLQLWLWIIFKLSKEAIDYRKEINDEYSFWREKLKALQEKDEAFVKSSKQCLKMKDTEKNFLQGTWREYLHSQISKLRKNFQSRNISL